MERLTVTYGDRTLVDVEVDELSWQDSDGQVCVSAKWRPKRAAPQSGGGGGLLDLITNASRQRTQEAADRKRAQRDIDDDTGTGTGDPAPSAT